MPTGFKSSQKKKSRRTKEKGKHVCAVPDSLLREAAGAILPRGVILSLLHGERSQAPRRNKAFILIRVIQLGVLAPCHVKHEEIPSQEG